MGDCGGWLTDSGCCADKETNNVFVVGGDAVMVIFLPFSRREICFSLFLNTLTSRRRVSGICLVVNGWNGNENVKIRTKCMQRIMLSQCRLENFTDQEGFQGIEGMARKWDHGDDRTLQKE